MTFDEARKLTGKDQFCIWVEDLAAVEDVVNFFGFDPEMGAWDWFDEDDKFPALLLLVIDETDEEEEPIFNWTDADDDEIQEYQEDEDVFYVLSDELEIVLTEEHLLERQIKQEIGL